MKKGKLKHIFALVGLLGVAPVAMGALAISNYSECGKFTACKAAAGSTYAPSSFNVD